MTNSDNPQGNPKSAEEALRANAELFDVSVSELKRIVADPQSTVWRDAEVARRNRDIEASDRDIGRT